MVDMIKCGRPSIVKTPEEFGQRANEYFDSITSIVIDEESGKEVVRWLDVPSMSGLALFMGYASRDSLHDISVNRIGFAEGYERVKTRLEAYKVSQLYKLKNATGCIFDLKNNHNWTDRVDVHSTVDVNVCDALKQARERAIALRQDRLSVAQLPESAIEAEFNLAPAVTSETKASVKPRNKLSRIKD